MDKKIKIKKVTNSELLNIVTVRWIADLLLTT